MVTPIKTAVTVNASKNADKTAADIQNNKDNKVLDLTFNNSLVKIVSIKFFMKYIPATIKTNRSITSKLLSISWKTDFVDVKPIIIASRVRSPPGWSG